MTWKSLNMVRGYELINCGVVCVCGNYILFRELFSKFFSNIIGLSGHRNKRKSVLEITKMYNFLL